MLHILRLMLAALIAVTGSVVAVAPATAEPPVDVYSTPGIHHVNGRTWQTQCEPYSVTRRCLTRIQATVVSQVGGVFRAHTGWAFNNLTYLPSPRSVWKGNPLAETKQWTDASGRAWRTECDTPATGRGACRTFAQASVIARTDTGYQWRSQWVLNSMTRFSTTPRVVPEPEATFPDPSLRACVTEALRLAPGAKLSPEAVRSITSLTCHDWQMARLDGIGQLPDLTFLDAAWNRITDLEPLRGNRSMTTLMLGDNRIEDLSPVSSLSALTTIEVSWNPVTDLSPLSGLTGLTAVSAADTGITTIAPLATLPDLRLLEVSHNPGLDLATIGQHSGLTYLSAADTGLQDLTHLATLSRLQWLDARDNDLTSLTHLPGSLIGANLASNQLTGLTGLETAADLVWLALDDNPVTSLAPLSQLHQLETLSLSGTQVADLTPLSGLTGLTVLDISGIPATDVSALAGLIHLDRLIALNTGITDFSPLDPLVARGLQIITTPGGGDWPLDAGTLGVTREQWLPESNSER